MRSGKKIRLHVSLMALAIVLLAALSACGGGATPAANTPAAPANTVAAPAPGNTPAAAATSAPKQGGTLRIGLDVDADTADPRLFTNTSSGRLRELVYDGLVYIKADYAPTPLLAESWDNPDDKTWVFHLRKGVKFHNGTELKAADVKYTFDSILDPKLNAPSRANLSVIQKVDVVDDYTVKFTLASAFAPFLSYMNTGIVSKALAEAAGSDIANKPVGTGPFKFVSWTMGASI
jgi:peptide/nickel transport system substrate-binding protein